MALPELRTLTVQQWRGICWAQGLTIRIKEDEERETEGLSLIQFSKMDFDFVQDQNLTDGQVRAAVLLALEPGKDLLVKLVRKYGCVVVVPCLQRAAWYPPGHHVREQLSSCSY